MCGITGIFAFNQVGKFNLINLAKATKCLTQRGPDDEGMYLEDFVGLGHRRLSILDLSEKGHQPMKSADGRYVLVFNGEIYNFRALRQQLEKEGISFVSECDTEVLLQLLIRKGQNCLSLLNGFFAFAFYDRLENSMLLARDRYGIKPLYYLADEDKFIFGSNFRSILAYGIEKQLDLTALYFYLQLNYIPAPSTILGPAKKVLPGQYLKVTKKNVATGFYYELPINSDHQNRTKETAETFRQLLEQSVKRRLISDVPLGAFLSGGLDSSVISLLANQFRPGLRTFSIGYPDAPYFDETIYAKEMADYLKTDHTTIQVSRKDLVDNIFEMLDQLDEPFADSSALPVYILCKKVRQEVSVALSGDGADELLGGYNKHQALYHSLQTSWKNQLVKRSGYLWNFLPASRNNFFANKIRQLKRYSNGLQFDLQDRYWFWLLLMPSSDVEKIMTPELLTRFSRDNYETGRQQLLNSVHHYPDLNGILSNDLKMVLPNDMLYKVDSMSMSQGLEVRVPFLDHELVDWVQGLPSEEKVTREGRKLILRNAFRNDLPEKILRRPKHGFEVPLTEWFRKDLKNLIFNDLLEPGFLRRQGIFREDTGTELKKRLFSVNPGDVHANIWALVVFQWWWRKYLQ